MQLWRGGRSERLDHLISAMLVLVVLLIALAAWALFGNVVSLLDRFRTPIYLFIFGAVVAFAMVPLVNLVQRAVGSRGAAVALAYILVFAGLVIFSVLLVNPFIHQGRALVENLKRPQPSSIQGLKTVRTAAISIANAVTDQQHQVLSGRSPSPQAVQQTQASIKTLQQDISGLSAGNPPAGQIEIPHSYVKPVAAQADGLATAYRKATTVPGTMNGQSLNQAVSYSKQTVRVATMAYTKTATTPILVLDAQIWCDKHGISVNLESKFGSALDRLDKQSASILNNGVGAASQAGTLLLNTILVVLISLYWISDGGRFIRWLTRLLPAGEREEGRYVMQNLDNIIGTYLRTQVLLALLAAAVVAVGALVFGIPYAIVIFLICFLLSLIPVIGPVILPIPPMIIAVLFTPWPRSLFFLAWVLVGEQIATNVIGPRVQGHRMAIHPLEAMAAALIGFPIAGFVGAFFAVPIVAFLHVVVQEVTRSYGHKPLAMDEDGHRPEPLRVAGVDGGGDVPKV